ncbi:MAG: alpha-galactosidase [Lachnospiraceae bacterium]|nr:alpha-galactosidase [Lachnospiraceae bacterium]
MIYQDYKLGNIKLRYIRDEERGQISMVLLPIGMEDCFEERRSIMQHRENVCEAWNVGSLCHLALRHHAQGNGAGNTLKYGQSTDGLKYVEQKVEESGQTIRIVTLLEAIEGYQAEHTVTYTAGENGIEIGTVFINKTGRTVTLDMITSFSLDNLSPLQKDDAPYKLKLHRFRGGWSLEGKHREEMVEELNLENPWFRAFPESERYGVIGSHPVKRWFPFGCVEDMERQVFWAAQMESISSWQMEFSRDGDCYSLSGGIADCEFGGWWKDIRDGERFSAPKAYVSVSNQGLWDVCQNITDMFQKYADMQPECERDLPILFNEWCTTWGKPTYDKMLKLADRLLEIPVSYLVIDAGWSEKKTDDGDPQCGNGDWKYDKEKFPQGLLSLSRTLNRQHLRLGIWMEFEVTTKGANVHEASFDTMHLHRNGEIIQTGKIRRFWDFRQKEVITYLKEKVIEFLRKNEIGYLKVDYNGSIGCGCDGAESQGEGLREQMQAVHAFFEMMRSELPDLVIENCASGGHRVEPSMIKLTAMSSFSDAHECREIPYIAANLHQLILPRQSQIWAVISPELSIREIQYRLVSAQLGRFCLSGEIDGLNDAQWYEVKRATFFYERVKHIIKNGRSVLFRNSSDNQRYLHGGQVLLREHGGEILVVCHAFEEPPEVIRGELPPGDWQITEHIGAACGMQIMDGGFEIAFQNWHEAFAVLLTNLYLCGLGKNEENQE